MLKKVIYFSIILTIVIAIIILVAKVILQNNFNKVVEQTTLITKNSQGRNARIREVNSTLDYISQIQDNFIAWSYLFEDLSKNINDQVIFRAIKVDKENRKIDFKGIAQTRESLLVLKEGLENSDLFLNVDFPIKNILEKENINFEIKAELNIEGI